jgi:short-subunit dehydrogenase
MKVKNKVIIVTGGGSGMGRELVLQLIQKEAKVAAVDIQAENLEETRSLAQATEGQLFTYVLDITDRAAVEALPEQVIEDLGALDGIINNAGIIQPFVDVKDLSMDQIEKVMKVNFYGSLYLIRAALPHLLQRPEAHILNVSSMGGFIPFPGQTIYGASKAAIKLLSEGLYAELKDSPVGVTVVHPGAVKTHISQNSGIEMEAGAEEESNVPMESASNAAAQMIEGMEKKRFRVLVGKDAKFLDLFYRFSPRRAVHFIVKKMGAFKKG